MPRRLLASLILAVLCLTSCGKESSSTSSVAAKEDALLVSAGEKTFEIKGPVSFKRDVMPVFLRHGCNAGDCHGASRGQDGFQLSLFGYDPEGDFYRLTEEHPGRRINLAEPASSLVLTKATGEVGHTGGELFQPDSEPAQILLRWLEEGAQRDPDDAALATGIRFDRESHRFAKPGETLDAKVIASYSDGSERDVTRWALFMTNNEAVSAIDERGRITTPRAGGANVFARFDKFTVGMELTVLPEGDFSWPDPAPHNYIDELVFAKLQDLQIVPSDLCTDEQFLRRVTIDLIGTLPTPEEYEAFLASPDPAKRTQLVDDLLARESFADLWAAKWGEWLRIFTDTNPGGGTGMKAGWNYYHWIREQMVENLPLDQFAQQLLGGNGSNFTNPTSNYYTMLPQGAIDPLKMGEDTAQIWLGIRTGCAMCHNHPFDRWTIDDYYAWTSFFTGVRRKHGSEAREYFTYVDVEAEPALHPVDEQPVPHRFLGGASPDVTDRDARKVLAGWMTTPDNQLFRENQANRIWAHFFGRGIVEPVDDVRISNPPSIGPLYKELGRRLGEDYAYDQRKLIRDICLSRTYQLSSGVNESNRQDERFFSHSQLRRMRADVLFDSLAQALDYDSSFRRSTATKAVALFEGGRRDDFNAYFFKTFGQARRESVCTCEDRTEANLSQALHLINGSTIDRAFNRGPKLVPGLMEKYDTHEQIIEALYVRALSRKPSEKEMTGILETLPDREEVKDQQALQASYNHVMWALLNSSEFLFNH